MKRILIPVLVVTVFTGFLFAQGWVESGHQIKHYIDPKTRPPLSLSEAYAIALAHVGPATNRLWCVSASCDVDYGQKTMTHWAFGFSNTNREITKVVVFFDKAACHMVGATCQGGQMQ